jgi:predicted ATPase/DNA-binding CsgD family transcriptional regulator
MTDADSLSDDFPLEPLTWREEDILILLAKRQTDREIAQTLTISLQTVKWYNKRLYAKLGVKNRREATARAEALGLLAAGAKEPAVSAHNLPAQTTPFVGRQRELEDLSNLLAQTDVRLVTILAPGGMGKTRLALKSAEQHSSHFVDGVFFVPLTVQGSEYQLASAIAERVGLHLQVGGNPKQQVLQYLRHKQTLLLLDNFEYALSGAGLVGELLLTAPDIKMLATSRERLNLSGETIYTISGMAMPGTDMSRDVLDEYGAVGLFLQTALHVYPSFEARAGDWGPIVQICRLVDGMPLGIVLAAAWVRVLSPGQIASEITRDFDFLSTEMRDVPQRQRSIRAVFASAWRRLSDAARTTFEKLSVCRGGFTLEAARKIATTNLPTLQLLADRGMLRRTQAGRYEVHELLRQFAEERMQQRSGSRGAYDGHSLYYAELLFNLEPELRSRRQAAALSKIEDDIENVQTAWLYALERGSDATVAMMLPSLYYFYETRGWFEEGEASFRKAARHFGSATRTDEQTLLLGRLLARQGAFAHRLGHYQQAAQVLQASLSILRGTSARAELAFTLSFIADLARSLGKYDESRQLCRQSLALFREVDDSWGIAGELHNLGVAAYHLGEFGEARDYYDESLARSRELDDPYGIVTSLIGIGVLAHDLGDYQQAEQLYTESLAMSEALDDQYGVAASLINLGRVYYLTDDLEKGKQSCQIGLEVSRELGDPWGTAASLINLGDITCKMEHFQESRAYFREALQIVTVLHSEPLEIEILVGMATLLADTGNEETALDLLTPILHHPPDDKEIRERAIQLRDRLEESLSEETVIDIQVRSSDKSIKAAVRQLFLLV